MPPVSVRNPPGLRRTRDQVAVHAADKSVVTDRSFHASTAMTQVRRRHPVRLMLAAVAMTGIFASAHADTTLYERLGGREAVGRIVDELIETTRVDPVSAHHFVKVNHKRLKQKIAEQICALAGGPVPFDGDDMKTTHAGLGITEEDFYRLVENLVAILDRSGVGTREKNELLRLLAPLKRDVVMK
jgi:hemoglobin